MIIIQIRKEVMAGKIISEKVVDSREYAGKTLLTKEQQFVTSKLERMEVEDISTGYKYYTQCKVFTFWKRTVEEPSTVRKGTFLEHADCPRKYVKRLCTTPKGTKKSEVKRKQAKAFGDKFRNIRKGEDRVTVSQLLVNTKKPVFMNGVMYNPIKLEISSDLLSKIKR